MTDAVPCWISGRNAGVAMRVSAHEPVVALCEAFEGAVVSTSANIHGQPPARTAEAVEEYFTSQLDGLLDAPVGKLASVTRIFDAMTGRVLRI